MLMLDAPSKLPFVYSVLLSEHWEFFSNRRKIKQTRKSEGEAGPSKCSRSWMVVNLLRITISVSRGHSLRERIAGYRINGCSFLVNAKHTLMLIELHLKFGCKRAAFFEPYTLMLEFRRRSKPAQRPEDG